MGSRQENDQFLFADCAISNLTEFANETTLIFNNYGAVNRTLVRVDVEPVWAFSLSLTVLSIKICMIAGMACVYHGWYTGNALHMKVMNLNTTQLAVRINVFGFPSIDTNETSAEILDGDLWSTRRVISSDDYEGNGGVTVP